MTEDLQPYLDDVPTYRTMFYEELPDCLNALSSDASPAAQIRASVTYNHVVEGMLALTGYYALAQDLRGTRNPARHAGIGPPHRRRRATPHGVGHLHLPPPRRGRRRQLGRLRVADERADAARARATEQGFALYDPLPFGLVQDEIMQYAADKGMRRFGTISSARGRPLAEIDLDYSPVQLEDTFADEDEKALAGASV